MPSVDSEIRYQSALDGITADQLRGGFFVDWPSPPDPDAHLRILQGSDFIELAIDTGSGHVIGFVTAISDGVLFAYIPLLEVLPDYQAHGIGRELMQRLLGRLSHLYAIDLLCDADVQPFYAKLGMRPTTAMLHRNYARQSGA
jgi:ribosomal protein S18 acetylase RimI-like enzyme